MEIGKNLHQGLKGLDLMTGQRLAEAGHFVLHARSEAQALDESGAAAGAGRSDLPSPAGMSSVADQANEFGGFNGVIHNLGLGYREARRIETTRRTIAALGAAARHQVRIGVSFSALGSSLHIARSFASSRISAIFASVGRVTAASLASPAVIFFGP